MYRTGQEVGIAWLSQVCNTEAISNHGEYTSGTGVSSVSKFFLFCSCVLISYIIFIFYSY